MAFTKERAAVETLEVKGYTWHGGQFWKPPIGKAPAYITDEVPVVKHDAAVESLATDLMKRIDKITGERHSIATLSSLRVSIVEACRAAMLQGAEPVQEWIPCSERMPEGVVSVLVTGDWFDYAISFWNGASWGDLDFEPPVTHWMPLPAAQQREE